MCIIHSLILGQMTKAVGGFRAFVTATKVAEDNLPKLAIFPNYNHSIPSDSARLADWLDVRLAEDVEIWEALRCSTFVCFCCPASFSFAFRAAPKYFKPHKLPDERFEYVDGGCYYYY
jgi:hypothetical protein